MAIETRIPRQRRRRRRCSSSSSGEGRWANGSQAGNGTIEWQSHSSLLRPRPSSPFPFHFGYTLLFRCFICFSNGSCTLGRVVAQARGGHTPVLAAVRTGHTDAHTDHIQTNWRETLGCVFAFAFPFQIHSHFALYSPLVRQWQCQLDVQSHSPLASDCHAIDIVRPLSQSCTRSPVEWMHLHNCTTTTADCSSSVC